MRDTKILLKILRETVAVWIMKTLGTRSEIWTIKKHFIWKIIFKDSYPVDNISNPGEEGSSITSELTLISVDTPTLRSWQEDQEQEGRVKEKPSVVIYIRHKLTNTSVTYFTPYVCVRVCVYVCVW